MIELVVQVVKRTPMWVWGDFAALLGAFSGRFVGRSLSLFALSRRQSGRNQFA